MCLNGKKQPGLLRPWFRAMIWQILGLFLFLGSAACQTNVTDSSFELSPTPLGSDAESPFPTPTLAGNLQDTVIPTFDASPTPIFVPSVTPFPTPTLTPKPEERVEIGNQAISRGDFSQAITQFENGLNSGQLTDEQAVAAHYQLGVSHFVEKQYPAAVETLTQLLLVAGDAAPIETHFFIAQSFANQGLWAESLPHYQAYLVQNADMAPYIQPLMADAYFGLGETETAVAALQTAVLAPAHRLVEYENRQRLIAYYREINDLPALINQYDSIKAIAQTDFTQAEMTYLAGLAELELGNTEAAYRRFQTNIESYPHIYESYLGLVQVVEAGVPVDEYRRGLVNYHAASFEPCVTAFQRYLDQTPVEELKFDAYLFLAFCHEGLGALEAATAVLNQFADIDPESALRNQGWMLHRAGLLDDAEALFLDYLSQYGSEVEAAAVAWQTAVYAANRNQIDTAIERFVSFANLYPVHEDAAEALYRAGMIAYQAEDVEKAVELWDQARLDLPQREFSRAATVWLLKTLPSVAETYTQTTTLDIANPLTDEIVEDYYSLRIIALTSDEAPFESERPFVLPTAAQSARLQKEADAWMRDWLALPPETEPATLTPQVAADRRIVVGQKLWRLGLLISAKRELEEVRIEYAQDPLVSYQLALFYRDLGLYRSSILAATAVMNSSGLSIQQIPRFLGQLIYPIYFADLIVPLAEQYGYDPRLQFALVRQESLYESFARSGAAARGLSQVIPATGTYIAQQLNWPDYELEDLNKPYVGLNFGAFYLAQQLGFFDHDVHAALAAYNGGPGNAARWYDTAASDIDLYLQTVDFFETRQYIKRIYVGYEIYEYLYDGE